MNQNFLEAARQRLKSQPKLSPQGQAYSDACLAGHARALERTRARLDIPYGPHPQQALDVFLPERDSTRPMPVLVFLHGGGWSNGSKEWCSFMAPAIATLGAILVCPSYRLFPQVDYPSPVEDCAAALRWAADHAVSLGGDPTRIVVGGHSAGAQIAALIALQPRPGSPVSVPASSVSGCYCVGATFNRRNVNPAVGPGFVPPGPADAVQPDSPLALTEGATVPFLLAWGEQENDRVQTTGREMERRLRLAGAPVHSHVIADRGHFQLHLDHGDPTSEAFRIFGEWFLRRTGAAPTQ